MSSRWSSSSTTITDRPADGTKVNQRLDAFANLLEIDDDEHARRRSCGLGEAASLQGDHRETVSQASNVPADGRPVRATVSISFKEYKTLSELVTKPRLQSADKSKRRVIVGLDSLWLLASREIQRRHQLARDRAGQRSR